MKIKCTGAECINNTDYFHPCPYQQDVENNDADYCDCCEECQQECADDI